MTVTMTEALRLAAAGELLLVVALLLRDHRRSRVTVAASVLIACIACYLAEPFLRGAGVPDAVRWAVGRGALAVPLALWLAARLFFDDSFQTKPVHVAALVALLGVRALVLPWPWAASLLGIVVVVDALRRVHTGAGSDLLLSRLRLRYAVVMGAGAYALLVLIAEAIPLPRGSAAAELLGAANDVGLFLLVSAVAGLILRVEPDLVRTARRPSMAAPPPTVLEKRLERMIREEHVYRTDGLTIGALSDRLGEQEYKVRQLINAHLGFRNFGAFLNHYRIEEARDVLADPAQKALGVAEIAYRLGYGSLGPFNRAFKELVGQTPSEYRKAAADRQPLGDSGIEEAPAKRR